MNCEKCGHKCGPGEGIQMLSDECIYFCLDCYRDFNAWCAAMDEQNVNYWYSEFLEAA